MFKTPPDQAQRPHNGALPRQTKGGAVLSDASGGPGAAPRTLSARRPKALGFCFGLHDFRFFSVQTVLEISAILRVMNRLCELTLTVGF